MNNDESISIKWIIEWAMITDNEELIGIMLDDYQTERELEHALMA